MPPSASFSGLSVPESRRAAHGPQDAACASIGKCLSFHNPGDTRSFRQGNIHGNPATSEIGSEWSRPQAHYIFIFLNFKSNIKKLPISLGTFKPKFKIHLR